MLRSWRIWVLLILLVIVAILTADWAMASARLPGVEIKTMLEKPSVMADGKDTATFTVTVTENGQPRVHDLLQIWLLKGSGQLIPQWVFTDEQGMAKITFTPNPYNAYDPQGSVEISIMDTNIGRLVEVGKHVSIEIPLEKPAAK